MIGKYLKKESDSKHSHIATTAKIVLANTATEPPLLTVRYIKEL